MPKASKALAAKKGNDINDDESDPHIIYIYIYIYTDTYPEAYTVDICIHIYIYIYVSCNSSRSILEIMKMG